MTRCELHSDVLPEVNMLALDLLDVESGEKIGRHHSHLSPSKTVMSVVSKH
jgi:hypothetical protein